MSLLAGALAVATPGVPWTAGFGSAAGAAGAAGLAASAGFAASVGLAGAAGGAGAAGPQAASSAALENSRPLFKNARRVGVAKDIPASGLSMSSLPGAIAPTTAPTQSLLPRTDNRLCPL